MSTYRAGPSRLPLTPEWMAVAECASVDPELWYPAEKGDAGRDAKAICGICEVQVECLEYAFAHREPYGIWGGMGAEERLRILRRKPLTADKPRRL